MSEELSLSRTRQRLKWGTSRGDQGTDKEQQATKYLKAQQQERMFLGASLTLISNSTALIRES